jgi:hypothetical protein
MRNNILNRALDSFNRPSDATFMKKVQGIRIVYDNLFSTRPSQACPSLEQLKARLIELAQEPEGLAIRHEILDVAIHIGCVDLVRVPGFEGYNIRPIERVPLGRKPASPHRSVLYRPNLPVPPHRVNLPVPHVVTIQELAKDSQNVHDSKVNDTALRVMRNIISDYPYSRHREREIFLQIEKDISNITSNFFIPSFLKRVPKKIARSISFIKSTEIDFNRGISPLCMLKNLLFAVYLWIGTHTGEKKDELMKRLVEELIDMSGTCSTGHMSRLVSVMQGYTSNTRYILELDLDPMKVLKDRFNKVLQDEANEEVMDGILDKNEAFTDFAIEKINALGIELGIEQDIRDEYISEMILI